MPVDMDKIADDFGKKLSDLLKEKNVTQYALAKKLDIQQQSISAYRKGNSVPDTLRLLKIAEYFDVSVDWLLGLSEYRSTDTGVKAVCRQTGLTEAAASCLIYVKDGYDEELLQSDFDIIKSDIIEYLLTNGLGILFELSRLKRTTEACLNTFPEQPISDVDDDLMDLCRFRLQERFRKMSDRISGYERLSKEFENLIERINAENYRIYMKTGDLNFDESIYDEIAEENNAE